jgi:hypothetical protein
MIPAEISKAIFSRATIIIQSRLLAHTIHIRDAAAVIYIGMIPVEASKTSHNTAKMAAIIIPARITQVS